MGHPAAVVAVVAVPAEGIEMRSLELTCLTLPPAVVGLVVALGSSRWVVAAVEGSCPCSRIVDASQQSAAAVVEGARSVAAKRVVPLKEKLY